MGIGEGLGEWWSSLVIWKFTLLGISRMGQMIENEEQSFIIS